MRCLFALYNSQHYFVMLKCEMWIVLCSWGRQMCFTLIGRLSAQTSATASMMFTQGFFISARLLLLLHYVLFLILFSYHFPRVMLAPYKRTTCVCVRVFCMDAVHITFSKYTWFSRTVCLCVCVSVWVCIYMHPFFHPNNIFRIVLLSFSIPFGRRLDV